MNGHVSPIARALGFAGLLPSLLLTALLVFSLDARLAEAARPLSLFYAAVILSFLGGIWWGFAMRRDSGQGGLLVAAVTPSLIAFFVIFAALLGVSARWAAVALGSAVLLTLLVDRHLVRTGEVPAGWMALRTPLSVGLGALTILSGAV